MIVYDKLILLFQDKIIRTRFIKFFLIGSVNFPLNIILVWFGTEIIGFYYLFSVVIAYFIITVINFFLHCSYIFKIKRNSTVFVRYIIVLAFFYFMHIVFVKILTDQFGVYYLLSVIVSVSILFLFKFVTYNKFVFTDK